MMTVDEVLINGRRYRVPERVIMLDFWNKVGRGSSHYDQYVILAAIHVDNVLNGYTGVQTTQAPCHLL